MARPRRDVVQLDRAAWYHCVSRCVRRGYWQGRSSVTGADCRHRKDWIEARLASLGKAFAIDVAAYAVMDNHVHVVEEIFPDGRMNTPLMTFNHYLKLVDLCGRRKRRGPRQKAIAPELRPILERLGVDERNISDRMEGFRQCHYYLIGSPETLKRESEACGRPCRYRSAAGRRWYRPTVSTPT